MSSSWSLLFKHVVPLARPYLCAAHLSGLRALDLSRREAPHPERLADKTKRMTGWDLVRAEGEVSQGAFFALLAERKFPLVYELRPEESLFSSAQPDLWHEVFGHLPFLWDPRMSEFYQEIGRIGRDADRDKDDSALNWATKLYWYLCEYGLVREGGELKMIGAGLIASPVGSFKARGLGAGLRIRKFDVSGLRNERFDPYRFQDSLYVLSDYKQISQNLCRPRPLLRLFHL